jgi:hypothetical protein
MVSTTSATRRYWVTTTVRSSAPRSLATAANPVAPPAIMPNTLRLPAHGFRNLTVPLVFSQSQLYTESRTAITGATRREVAGLPPLQ